MVKRIRSRLVLLCALTITCFPLLSLAAQQCALTFVGCPETFNGDTIKVPSNVGKVYSLVHACNAAQTIHTGTGTASILFVIDNSGSMKGTSGNDPTGARFTVTSALLDSIVAKEPQAEVGLVVFREHLFFDTTTTQYYTQYFKALHPVLDSEPDQAYLPFMGLTQTYNGRTGLQIIKDILTTNNAGDDLLYQPLYRNVRPNNGGGETNINGAYIAAKQAFLSAKNPKANQFVIFLSDGDPQGNDQAGLPPDYFDTPAGVTGVPTTFTVFFTKTGQAPATLATMTTNIQQSGYSTSNPESNLFTVQASYTSLMSLLLNNVISNILVSGNPTKMVLNGNTSTIYVDSSFFFSDSFPVTQNPTPFNMNISYRYVNPTTQILSDTVVAVHFYVQSVQQAVTLPPGVQMVCQSGPVGAIPVVATLLDTNHDGHLDRIDISWTDTASMKQAMPTIAQFIQTLQITTLDGKKVTLTAASLQPDLANKTIHVILTQNTGSTYETAWQPGPQILLTTIPMSNAGGWFSVDSVVDGAAPVIKNVCFVPMPLADTLHVEFSEPLTGQNPPVDPYNSFALYTAQGAYNFGTNKPTVVTKGDMLVYAFKGNQITTADSIVEYTRPAFHLSTCGAVSIVTNSLAVGNPFVPGKSVIPPSQRTPNGSPSGTRIEVALIPAISGDLQNGQVKGTLTILDAVGNVIVDKTDMFPDVTSVKIFWVWNGKTRTGAWAAPGTYLARITVQDLANNVKQNIRMNVGVRHQ